MAMLDIHHILRIKVLEDSAECGVFVISVYCGEPLLLRFWRRKPLFRNGQVEQTDVNSRAVAELHFVLRALNRAPNLPNSHYWGPFVLALCLDALPFRFRLPAEAHSSSRIQDIMEDCGELTLLRWEASNCRTRGGKRLHKTSSVKYVFFLQRLDSRFRHSILGFKRLYVHDQLCTPAWTVFSHTHPPWPAMHVRPKTNHHNITGLTAHTIVGRALGALWWAKHTITQCGEEDERTAAGKGKLEEHSKRRQGLQQRKEEKGEEKYTNGTQPASLLIFYVFLWKKQRQNKSGWTRGNTKLTIVGKVASILKDYDRRKLRQSYWLLKTQKRISLKPISINHFYSMNVWAPAKCGRRLFAAGLCSKLLSFCILQRQHSICIRVRVMGRLCWKNVIIYFGSI